VAVGQEPACVKTCPTGAIMFGTKEAMKDQAEERIADLKERGFERPACTTRKAWAAPT
jgi:formate dehydrogenase iron-sulfur subunit